MNTSDAPRNTMARKPSHFGSYRKSPSGRASASLASIGSMGGARGSGLARGGMVEMYAAPRQLDARRPGSYHRPMAQRVCQLSVAFFPTSPETGRGWRRARD